MIYYPLKKLKHSLVIFFLQFFTVPDVSCGFILNLIAVNWNIQKEVAQYERKYRGKELPGFVNYKTFEAMVQEQIKELEEPAVMKLKEVAGRLTTCDYLVSTSDCVRCTEKLANDCNWTFPA